LDSVIILELNADNYIKSYTDPEANKSHNPATHVIEEVCYYRLSSRHKNAVRRNLFNQVLFSYWARSELT